MLDRRAFFRFFGRTAATVAGVVIGVGAALPAARWRKIENLPMEPLVDLDVVRLMDPLNELDALSASARRALNQIQRNTIA